MPMPCYALIKGKNQGEIKGSSKVRGHEGRILVQAVDHVIEIPRNPQSGLTTGKRVHGPMRLTKEVDQSSPKLFQALTSGEQMEEVSLAYIRITDQGTEERYYTVKLENAILTHIRAWVPNCLDHAHQHIGHMEDICFTYEKISWTFEPDGIEAEDSWLAPKT